MSVIILIGSPPNELDNNYFVKVLNSGTTTNTSIPKDFHDWDEQGFKTNVVQHFVCFLSHTSGMYFAQLPHHTEPVDRYATSDQLTKDPVPCEPCNHLTDPVAQPSSPSSLGGPCNADLDHVPNRGELAKCNSTPEPLPAPDWPLCVFLSFLHHAVNSLPHAAAKARTSKLTQMSSYKFAWECNIARNREMGENLGLGKSNSGDKKQGEWKDVKYTYIFSGFSFQSKGIFCPGCGQTGHSMAHWPGLVPSTPSTLCPLPPLFRSIRCSHIQIT
jgi:hypothetical protein